MTRVTGPAKHVWIELIAFDVTRDDLGVEQVLADMGDRPTILSLLLFSAELVHAHGTDDDGLIPTECTSYAARPDSVRGPRQDWTRARLRQLVTALQASGIAVYFAVFDLHQYPLDGEVRHSAWNLAHPEMTVTDSSGEPVPGLLNPLKRLADGRFYQDVFADGLVAVFDYYGFDGLHGADGYTSPRLPVWRADFSDDLIHQFEDATACTVPAGPTVDRSAWIWAEARLEWIEFIAARWTGFWSAVVDRLHAVGAKTMLNNAWTRDPFEALYRYGVDYAALARIGIDRMVLETSSSAVELLEEPTLPPIHGQLATVLLIRAHVPELPLSGLVAVHDTFEQWDVVHTAPAMLERDIRTLTSVRAQRPGGATTAPCLDAALFCLADGLDAASWNRLDVLRRSCESGTSPSADAGAGFTLLYDPAVLRKELASFRRNRVAHTHTLLATLLRAGAIISAIAPIGDHRLVPGAVLVLRPDVYPSDLLDDVAASHDEFVTFGPTLDTDGGFDGSWSVVRRESGGMVDVWREEAAGRRIDDGEPEAQDSWLFELAMNLPPTDLVERVAAVLRAPALGEGGPFTAPGASSSVQLMVSRESPTTTRVLLHNSDHVFRDGTFRPAEPVTGAELLSGSASLAVRFVDGAVVVRVPPKGVSALRLTGAAVTSTASTRPSTPSEELP